MNEELEYETTYGYCLAENPYWFKPDIECNTAEELLSWRHAIHAVDEGTFECPEHYFYKEVDGCLIHGHNSPWGMGISGFSEKGEVWTSGTWVLDLARSSATDEVFVSAILAISQRRKEDFEKRERRWKYED